MRANIILGTILAILATFLLLPEKANSVPAESDLPFPIEQIALPEDAPPVKETLTEAQEAWLADLRQCESSGNDNAVNAVDLDGTASYGRYQFKPGTFAGYIRLYELPYAPSDYMNGEAQQEILERMVLDESITYEDWRYQLFPWCVKKYGMPPR